MTLAEQQSLQQRFAACQLTAQEWTHAAHLAVAAWYLANLPAEAAGQQMRTGIRRLNESLGGQNTETSGFHETLTEFWLQILARELQAGTTLPQLVALPSGLWREYYSWDLPQCRRARREWVKPDLQPIAASSE